MDWTIFAIVQMGVIATGISLACYLRYRGVAKENTALRDHCDVVNEQAAGASPEEWVAEQIAALSDEPHAKICQVVLEHALTAKDDLSDQLAAAVEAAGMSGGGEDQSARVAELEEALDKANQATIEDADNDLKNLILQFTQDSRELMACIQTLESENDNLRKQITDLGADPGPVAGEEPQEAEPEAATA